MRKTSQKLFVQGGKAGERNGNGEKWSLSRMKKKNGERKNLLNVNKAIISILQDQHTLDM